MRNIYYIHVANNMYLSCTYQVREGVSSDQLAATLDACRHAISSDHGVALQSMILVKTRTIDKTTSGKIARAWCRRSYLQGSLQIVAKWEAPPLTGNGEDEKEEMGGVIMGVGIDSVAAGSEGTGQVGEHMEVDGPVPTVDKDKYHSMPLSEIEDLLERKLLQITASSATGELPSPVDRNVCMTALGLESMTMVQFKGVIENR